jgi:hypothetical protein
MKGQRHLRADKREIKDFPKSRLVGTSFIRRTVAGGSRERGEVGRKQEIPNNKQITNDK